MQVVVLQSPPLSEKPRIRSHNIHILKLSYIKEVLPLKEDEKSKLKLQGTQHLVPVTNVSVDKVMAREQAALRLEREKLSRVGQNVSSEAQVGQ